MAIITAKQKQDWLNNLRSGDFRRGKNKLCRITGSTARYCCLGVLYETVRGEDAWIDASVSTREPGDPVDLQPPQGNSTFWRDGLLSLKDACVLASKNDNGWSFRRLANWIEKNVPAAG